MSETEADKLKKCIHGYEIQNWCIKCKEKYDKMRYTDGWNDVLKEIDKMFKSGLTLCGIKKKCKKIKIKGVES